jgi:uncharacterized integral membrane protein
MAAIDQQLDSDGEHLAANGAADAPGPVASPTGGTSVEEVKRSPTRLSAAWTAVVIATVLLVALVVFIAQNTQRSSVNFFGAHGHAPTAVVLLIAALSGAVIVIVVGMARILQLRRRAGRAVDTTAPRR